jgi:FkbM family methyltransferase
MALEVVRFELASRLRPILSLMPRGYGWAYRWLLGPTGSTYHGDALLKAKLSSRLRIFRDRHLQCHVIADVGDAGSRRHYILSRYYETFVPLVIKSCLEPRDTFIDVGANRGIHTMFASRYLTSGRVVSFEPNPRTFRILEAHLAMNGLKNCEVHNMGLSDENQTLSLNLFSDDAPSGCSFIDKGQNAVMERFEVPVRRLDEVLGSKGLKGRTLIKIDTEGFDHRVVRGIGKLLEHRELAILTEVMDDWLRRAGSSAQAFFDEMIDRGFEALLPSVRHRGLRESLRLEPMTRFENRGDQFDILFAKPGMVPESLKEAPPR